MFREFGQNYQTFSHFRMFNMAVPKIAVIMSVYHKDNHHMLIDSIESIVNQTVDNDLLIYCDGELNQELYTVIDNYKECSNIHVFYGEYNRGLAFALNYLIDIALKHGYDYIARMDSDDISYSSRLERQVEFMTSNPHLDVSGTSCREFGSNFALSNKTLPSNHEELKDFSVARCPFIHPTVIFKTEVFISGIRYPTNTSFTEDMALWFELLKLGCRFGNLQEILLDYRLNENTLAKRAGLAKATSEMALRFKYMFIFRRFSFKNTLLILFRLPFHLLPESFAKFIYKNMR